LNSVPESHAAEISCVRLTDSELHSLDSLLVESKQAIDKQKYLVSSDLGRQIHDVLVQKVDNSRLTLYLNDLDAHYTRIRRLSALMEGRLSKSHEQHVAILSALRARDAEGARQPWPIIYCLCGTTFSCTSMTGLLIWLRITDCITVNNYTPDGKLKYPKQPDEL
jgi:hypothetical protein